MKRTRKKGLRPMILMIFLFAFLRMVSPATEVPAHRFMATAGVNAFRGASGDLRQIYGPTAFMPEIKLTCLVYKNFSVWGGCGVISRQGFIEEVEETAKINQTFLALGVGCAHRLSAKLRLRGELGLAYISFKEDALAMIQKGSGLGWKIGADLDYLFGKQVFVTLTASYSQAGDKVEAGKIELGGVQLGTGIGFIF